MIKGGTTLFNEIFTEQATATTTTTRGRSSIFDKDRNECLISRYYFFGLHTGFRYELLIKIISQQFWLSEVTVYNILKTNHQTLVDIRKQKPVKNDLKKRWPHLSWELPEIKDYI